MYFEIRHALAADWPAVALVHERSVRHELHFLDETARPRMADLEHVFRGDLWVAEAKKAGIVGFVACVGNDIAWLYVDPSCFRRGIGRALLQHCLQHCGAIVNATVLSDNVACLALMGSEGFVLADRDAVMIRGHGETRVHRLRRIELFDRTGQAQLQRAG